MTNTFIRQAIEQVQKGEPGEAIKAIDAALKQPANQDKIKLLEKSKEECEFGTLANAETFLTMALNS